MCSVEPAARVVTERRIHATDREVIEKVLTEYAAVPYAHGTEHGMAPDLVRAGIAPERIVPSFHLAGARRFSDFQAA